MRSLRFLLSRRWLVFALVVAALAWLAVQLGEWQFHRLGERQESNRIVEANVHAPPLPVGEVLAVGAPVSPREEWRRVRATGSYQAAGTVIVRYRTREGTSGVNVVVPLVTTAGPALLVDRGWLQTANSGAGEVAVPDPPSGRVTVTGWVRADAEPGDAATVRDGSTRAVSSEQIGRTLDRPVYGGFLALQSEDPPPARPLMPPELPETGSGPHFFYGLQWWFFGALAVFGFCYLAYDEWRRARRPDAAPAPRPGVSRPGRSAR